MATFTLDAAIEPTYIDILDVAQGYGIFSVPMSGVLPGDQVQLVALVVTNTAGAEIIAKAVDQAQRTDGYYEYVTQSEIDAHFTLLPADVALLAGSSDDFSYSVTATILRSSSTYTREVQGGAIAARATTPLPPIIVNSITITGGPTSGAPGTTHQLTATTKDGFGNTVTGIPVAWASTDIAVATVDVNGLVHFVTPGTVTITATCQGLTATTTATTSITPTPANDDILVWVSIDSQWEPFPLLWTRVLDTPTTLLGYGITGPAYALGVNATGTNAAAAAVSLTAPISTGTAAPAAIHVQVTHVGLISGTTPQTLADVAYFADRMARFPYGISVTGSPITADSSLPRPPAFLQATDHVGLNLVAGAGELADYLLQSSKVAIDASNYVMATAVGGQDVLFYGGIDVTATAALAATTCTTLTASGQVAAASYKVGSDVGASYTGVPHNITVVNGIITAIN